MVSDKESEDIFEGYEVLAIVLNRETQFTKRKINTENMVRKIVKVPPILKNLCFE